MMSFMYYVVKNIHVAVYYLLFQTPLQLTYKRNDTKLRIHENK